MSYRNFVGSIEKIANYNDHKKDWAIRDREPNNSIRQSMPLSSTTRSYSNFLSINTDSLAASSAATSHSLKQKNHTCPNKKERDHADYNDDDDDLQMLTKMTYNDHIKSNLEHIISSTKTTTTPTPTTSTIEESIAFNKTLNAENYFKVISNTLLSSSSSSNTTTSFHITELKEPTSASKQFCSLFNLPNDSLKIFKIKAHSSIRRFKRSSLSNIRYKSSSTSKAKINLKSSCTIGDCRSKSSSSGYNTTTSSDRRVSSSSKKSKKLFRSFSQRISLSSNSISRSNLMKMSNEKTDVADNMTHFHQVIKCSPPPSTALPTKCCGGHGSLLNLRNVNSRVKAFLNVSNEKMFNTNFVRLNMTNNELIISNEDESGEITSKSYTFDKIINANKLNQTQISSLIISSNDVIDSILNGFDSCVFTYGQNKNEKYRTMIGDDKSNKSLGIVPMTVYCLFKHLNELKQINSIRYSVNISMMELNENGKIKDLLFNSMQNKYEHELKDILIVQQRRKQPRILKALRKCRVFSDEMALKFIDVALAFKNDNEHSHMLITLFVQQEDSNDKKNLIKSRLSFIDFGHLQNETHDEFGDMLIKVINNDANLNDLFRNSNDHRRLTCQLIKETMSSSDCKISMISHLSQTLPLSMRNSKTLRSQMNKDTVKIIELTSSIFELRNQYLNNKINNFNIDKLIKYKSEMNLINQTRHMNIGHIHLDNNNNNDELKANTISSLSSNQINLSSGSEISCDTIVNYDKNLENNINDSTLALLNSNENENTLKKNKSLSNPSTSSSSSSSSSPLSSLISYSSVCCSTNESSSSPSSSSSASPHSQASLNKSGISRIKLGISSNSFNSSHKLRSSSTDGRSTSSLSNAINMLKSNNNTLKCNKTKQSNEIWIDGPHSNINTSRRSPVKILADTIKLNEIWIDGPNASLPPPSSTTIKSNDCFINNKMANKNIVKSNFSDSINNNSNKLDTLESLECLDRALLRQLNEQEMSLIDTVNKLDANNNSRPISLLSVNSNCDTTSIATTATVTSLTNTVTKSISEDNEQLDFLNDFTLSFINEFSSSDSLKSKCSNNNASYRKKLKDLKSSYDQMIFKQSYKEMESLHKQLETFLSLEAANKLTMKLNDQNTLRPTMSTTNIQAPSKSSSEKPKIDDLKYLTELKLNNLFANNVSSNNYCGESCSMETLRDLKNASMTCVGFNDSQDENSTLSRSTRFRAAPQIQQYMVNGMTYSKMDNVDFSSAKTLNSPLMATNSVSQLAKSNNSSPTGCPNASLSLSTSSTSSSSSYQCCSSPSAASTSSSTSKDSNLIKNDSNSANYSVPISLFNSSANFLNSTQNENLSLMNKSLNSNECQYSEPFDYLNSNQTQYVNLSDEQVNKPQSPFKRINNCNCDCQTGFFNSTTRGPNNINQNNQITNRLFFNFNNNSNNLNNYYYNNNELNTRSSSQLSEHKSLRTTTTSNLSNDSMSNVKKSLNKSKSQSTSNTSSASTSSMPSTPHVNSSIQRKASVNNANINKNSQQSDQIIYQQQQSSCNQNLLTNCHSLKKIANKYKNHFSDDYYSSRQSSNQNVDKVTSKPPKESFINRIFSRSKSKDKPATSTPIFIHQNSKQNDEAKTNTNVEVGPLKPCDNRQSKEMTESKSNKQELVPVVVQKRNRFRNFVSIFSNINSKNDESSNFQVGKNEASVNVNVKKDSSTMSLNEIKEPTRDKIEILINKKLLLEKELRQTSIKLTDINNSRCSICNNINNNNNYTHLVYEDDVNSIFKMEKEIFRLEKLVLNARTNLMMINSFRI